MLADPLHTLLPKQRLPIYDSIFYTLDSYSDEPFISIFWGCLAIVTARKVLPVWENEMPGDNLGQRILEISEGLLSGKLTNLETQYERGSLQRAVGNSEQFVESGRARAALKAIYSTLEPESGYFPFERFSKRQIEAGLPDELIADIGGDTAGLAVLAYSGFVYDQETLWLLEKSFKEKQAELDKLPRSKSSILFSIPASFLKKVFVRENFEGHFHRLEQGPDNDFDPELRKEFWEWWLFEGIPKAWDLLQQIDERTGKKDKNEMPLEF
jgi:hypothetical protein